MLFRLCLISADGGIEIGDQLKISSKILQQIRHFNSRKGGLFTRYQVNSEWCRRVSTRPGRPAHHTCACSHLFRHQRNLEAAGSDGNRDVIFRAEYRPLTNSMAYALAYANIG